MKYSVSHSFEEESLEAKARWFQKKTIKQRLREALEGIVFVAKIRKFEPPDDRTTFKTVLVLEPKAS